MLARTSRIVLTLAALAVTSACQGPDVGQPCTLSWEDPSTKPVASEIESDYIEFSAFDCENLVCIVSPAAAGTEYGGRGDGVGYCSKPCVSDRDCYPDETGLSCRTIVLDAEFLATLPLETRNRYLGDIQYLSYCALAR